jgi:hypothetical protein
MTIIRKKFKITIPDEFLHDDIDTPSSQEWEYIGEDKIYVLVDKTTNKPHFGTLNVDMINDGRPIPLDKYVVEINSEEEPLIATLLCGPGKEDNDFEKNRPENTFLVHSDEEYGEYRENYEYHPREIYNLDEIKYIPQLKKWDLNVNRYINVMNIPELTWDMLREKRDNELKATDGMESGDMPDSMITELRKYRTKLRNWPNKLKDLDPWIAYNLFPKKPEWI